MGVAVRLHNLPLESLIISNSSGRRTSVLHSGCGAPEWGTLNRVLVFSCRAWCRHTHGTRRFWVGAPAVCFGRFFFVHAVSLQALQQSLGHRGFSGHLLSVPWTRIGRPFARRAASTERPVSTFMVTTQK